LGAFPTRLLGFARNDRRRARNDTRRFLSLPGGASRRGSLGLLCSAFPFSGAAYLRACTGDAPQFCERVLSSKFQPRHQTNRGVIASGCAHVRLAVFLCGSVLRLDHTIDECPRVALGRGCNEAGQAGSSDGCSIVFGRRRPGQSLAVETKPWLRTRQSAPAMQVLLTS